MHPLSSILSSAYHSLKLFGKYPEARAFGCGLRSRLGLARSTMSSHASFAPTQSLAMTKPIGGAATTNDIVSAHKSGKKKQSTAARLNALVDQFQAFYGGLEHDVIAEHEDQEDKMATVERYVIRLQKSLVVEQTRRIEMLDHVENNLKQQFEVVWVRNKAQMEALKPDIPKRIVQWHARLAADEEIMEEVCRGHRASLAAAGEAGEAGRVRGRGGSGCWWRCRETPARACMHPAPTPPPQAVPASLPASRPPATPALRASRRRHATAAPRARTAGAGRAEDRDREGAVAAAQAARRLPGAPRD